MALDPAQYPAWLGDMVSWINSGGKQWMYDINTQGGVNNPKGEGGVDLGAAYRSPVYALADGPIMGVDINEQGGSRLGGVVSQRVSVPGYGTQDIYYQHLDVDQTLLHQCSWGTCNISVKKGQKIGTVGTAGETEVGFNSAWGAAWGNASDHPAPWSTKPEQMIAALMGGGGQYLGSLNTATGGTPQVQNANLQGFAVKAGLFVAALLLLAFGAYLLFKPQADAALSKGAKTAMKVGVLA